MGKRRVAKRVVCLSLASFLFAASLTGCGKKGGDPVEEAKRLTRIVYISRKNWKEY